MTEFSALYARYSRDVFRFALYLSGDRDEAADITSETFVRAWTAPGELRMSTVKGYLFAIARNVYLKGLRRSRRHVEIDETLRESLSDPAPGPQALAERFAEWDVAWRGLQRLSEIDRSALIMRAVDEMPYDEIARALGLTLAATKVKIHRARRALLQLRDASPRNDERAR